MTDHTPEPTDKPADKPTNPTAYLDRRGSNPLQNYICPRFLIRSSHQDIIRQKPYTVIQLQPLGHPGYRPAPFSPKINDPGFLRVTDALASINRQMSPNKPPALVKVDPNIPMPMSFIELRQLFQGYANIRYVAPDQSFSDIETKATREIEELLELVGRPTATSPAEFKLPPLEHRLVINQDKLNTHIEVWTAELERIYKNRTAGDYTWLGVISEIVTGLNELIEVQYRIAAPEPGDFPHPSSTDPYPKENS